MYRSKYTQGHIKYLSRILYIMSLILIFVVQVFPIYYILLTSLKYEARIFDRPTSYVPIPITFENYIVAWKESGFALFFLNTFVISLTSLISVIIIATMASYAISRYSYRGKKLVTILLLLTQMVPQALLMIPVFVLFKDIHLINTLTSVIIMTVAGNLAYCTFMLKGFFSTISVQLEQAAWIDGCSKLQAVVRIILPIMLPGLVATGAFAFVSGWNSYLMPLLLLSEQKKYTLTIGLNMLQGQYSIHYGRLAAAGMFCLIPAVAMFGYMQKYMVSGISSGAIKG